jgi:hypothetical protein
MVMALPHQWAPQLPNPARLGLELRASTGVIPLTRYVHAGSVIVTRGATGFGLPDVDAHWWTGAADGAHYRDTRVKERTITLPLGVFDDTRERVQARLDELAVALAPAVAPATLRVIEPGAHSWDVDVVRTGGSDWVWGTSSNGRTFCKFSVQLTAGDPYFTRVAPATAVVGANRGRGLLGPPDTSLSQLRLSAGGTSAFGTVALDNPGSAPAYPVVTVTGPATGLDLQSQGVGLTWSGTLAAGESLTLDHQAGTIVDGAGANRYGELGPAPRFWRVPPGRTTATVAITGIDPAVSQAELSWRPRRWLVY